MAESRAAKQADVEVARNVRDALRWIRTMIDASLPGFERWLHLECPAPRGGGMAPEQMLRALALNAIWGSPRSEILLDTIWAHATYRDFVGVQPGTPRWDTATFARYRNQMLDKYLIHRFLVQVLQDAVQEGMFGARRMELPSAATGASAEPEVCD